MADQLSGATAPALTSETLELLGATATENGLVRLGIVRLDHPGFVPARAALDRHLQAGKAGEMAFMKRTQEVRKYPEQMLEGAKSMLLALAPYGGEPGPVARYARGPDYHTVLYQRLEAVEKQLHVHCPAAETLICVDTRPVLERAAAMLAGLGFLGKHGCLIAPGLGSYVMIGGILTTAKWLGPDLDIDTQAPPWDACGSCTRCLDACPTQAFDAPGDLDPRRCLSYLTIEHRGPIPEALAGALGERVVGCDVCQEVCPYNKGRDRSSRAPAAAWLTPWPDDPDRDPDPVRLASIRSGAHRRLCKGSALRRIPRRALRRNALLALGCRTGPLQPDERAVLEAAMADSEPLVAEAATWAAKRRGLNVDESAPRDR